MSVAKYDLLTTVLHELGHLHGFIEGYSGFDQLVSSGLDGVVFDDSHLDREAHPNDLLNSHLAPGVRKLPSQLNIELLQAMLSETIPLNPPYQGELNASLDNFLL